MNIRIIFVFLRLGELLFLTLENEFNPFIKMTPCCMQSLMPHVFDVMTISKTRYNNV